MTPRTVLIVEDEPELREAMTDLLRGSGYEVVACADGFEAEGVLVDSLPDLAVIEMLLAGRSGFQVARLVNERSNGRVPVIMTSWVGSPAHRDYALAAGADAFLRKPFALRDLVALAVRLCPPRPGSGSRAIPRPHPVRS